MNNIGALTDMLASIRGPHNYAQIFGTYLTADASNSECNFSEDFGTK